MGARSTDRSSGNFELTIAWFEFFKLENFADDRHIKLKEEGEQWHLFSCCHNLAYERYVYRSQEKCGFVTDVSCSSESHALSSLDDDRQSRFVFGCVARSRRGQSIESKTRHRGGMFSRRPNTASNLPGQLSPDSDEFQFPIYVCNWSSIHVVDPTQRLKQSISEPEPDASGNP